MIIVSGLKTLEEFENLKKGDWLACEFHRDISDYPKKYRFNVFKICLIKKEDNEIILKVKNNIYFNYKMFLQGESNLKRAILIKHQEIL